MSLACTCGVGDSPLVHEGDCPRRCTFWFRDYHSDCIAQCDRIAKHGGDHRPNLYRGSPSARAERGLGDLAWPIAIPECDEPASETDEPCPYFYLEPDCSCLLKRGHREVHVASSADRHLNSGESAMELAK